VSQAGTTCDEPVVTMDLFNTLLNAAGLPTEASDGIDLSPLLNSPDAKLPRDALFFHYPHYYHTTTPVSAIRSRDWKLLEYFEDCHVELYNLKDDPREQRDLAQENPDKVNALRQQLHAWRDSVNAALPTTNPDFKTAKRAAPKTQ
jgi:arylsulfatase A